MTTTKLEGKEVLSHGKGYATVYPSYNAVFDGFYLQDWNDVLNRLENPLQLDITSSDLKKLKESDAKKALVLKFKNGGYECGPAVLVKDLKSGDIKPSRATGTPKLKQYNLVVIDADGPKDGILDVNFDDKLKEVIGGYEYYAHSTISSTDTAKRRRIVIPLASPITADVREAFIRFLSDKLGMHNVDKASKNARQMMCFPVYTKDGEKYNYHNTGKLMNAVEWLPAGWEDVSNWPRWEDEKKIKCNKVSGDIKKRLDIEQGEWIPCFDKNKLHYAYNRTYRVSDVLKASGKYTQESPIRWSHTYDNAKGGIQVTNDSWLWSHYGNDALSTGTPLDAYETAMILKFGSLDKDNWKKMIAEVSKDDKVRKSLISEYADMLPDDADQWALYYDSSEEGLAQRCVAMYPHKIRDGKWWRYDNGIYHKVKDEAMLGDALRMIRIASALQPDDDNLREMIGRVSVAKNICTAWKGLASIQEIPEEQWESNLWYMHFTDCVIDLKALCQGNKEYKLKHNPDYLMTESTGYAWEDVANVKSNAMDEVLTNLAVYLPDEKVRHYCQMALGRALTGVSCNEDKCVWLLSNRSGKDGGNGKSTMLYAIRGAMGSYYYTMESDVLYYSARDTKSGEGPSPAKNGMRNKRFVQFSEYDAVRSLDENKYKNFTSAGFLNARGLQENGGNFQLKACCNVDTNGMPGIRKREESLLRRTRFIPFNAILSGSSDVKARWTHSHDIHVAMMAWLILGLKAWYDNGMKIDSNIKDENIPSEVYLTTMEWFNSFDSPSDFFDEVYEITGNEKDFIDADEAWQVYQTQIYDRGASRHAFRQAEAMWLREHGITEKRKREVAGGLRRMCYVGVRLRATVDSDYGSHGKYNHLKLVKRDNDIEEEEEVVEEKVEEVIEPKKTVTQPNIFFAENAFSDKDVEVV